MTGDSNSVEFVGVIGAGAMGRGIAQLAAAAGHRVVLGDAEAPAVVRARESIANTLARDVEKGRIDRPGADAVLSRISDAGSVLYSVEAFAGCDIVIEAVVESLDAKRALFARLEPVVGDACILASNTSSLSIAAI